MSRNSLELCCKDVSRIHTTYERLYENYCSLFFLIQGHGHPKGHGHSHGGHGHSHGGHGHSHGSPGSGSYPTQPEVPPHIAGQVRNAN